jgi:perosamine synthetase
MKLQPSLTPRFNYDYNFNDLVYSIKSIFANNSNDLSALSVIFDNRNFFFTNNGRSSLYVILRALNLPKGSKVGVPLYSCTVVFDAVIKAGYVPYFIDLEFSNCTLDPHDLKNKIRNLDALIVIHTFGRPADMDEIKKISNGIPVIEDCAHSLLSEYKGKKTGTLGNASFFSFGKYISAGDGGMIILNSNDNEFKNNIKTELCMLASPSSLNEIKDSFFAYIYSFLYHKPWFGGFAYPIGCYLDKRINISGNKGFYATKIKNSSLKVFLRKLETFKVKVELQRKNSHMLIDELKNTGLNLPYERKDVWCNYFLFPILFDSKTKRDNAYENLKNMGVDTARLYSMTPAVARQFYRYKGDCPNTEKFADIILTIPNHYTLKYRELLKIANAVKNLGN